MYLENYSIPLLVYCTRFTCKFARQMDQGSSAGASPIEPEKCGCMSVANSFLTRRKLNIQDTAKRMTTEGLMLFSLALVNLFDRSYFCFYIQTDYTAADSLMQTFTVMADVSDKELQLISRSPAVFFQSTADDLFRP